MASSKSENRADKIADSKSKKLKPIRNANQFTLKSYLESSPSPPRKPVASTSKAKDIIEIGDSGSETEESSVKKVDAEEEPKAKRLKTSPSKGKSKATALPEQLWVDQYAPRDLDDLVVHKKKVADVQNWLTEALENPKLAKYRRILILSGPAGAAKTATIKVLSQEMGFQILEYKSGQEGGADSLVNQFPAFLNRAASVPMLSFSDTPAADSNGKGKQKATRPSKKVILVEDLPNIFSSFPTKQAFRSALISFANSSRAYAQGIPLVLIISEALAKTSNDSEWAVAEGGGSNWQDNVSARNLVPVEVLKGGKCSEIKYNRVAITLMRKALNTTLDRIFTAKSSATSLKQPSPEALDVIGRAANGDIRAALNSLQFLVKEGKYSEGVTSIMADVVVKKGKKRKAGGKLKDEESSALAHLGSARESSLFLFHALGKVLFSKRWGEKPEEDAKDLRVKLPKTDKLPSHLLQFTRRISKVDPNILFADAPVDADMFMGYLHQNYAPFCVDIDQCANSMEYFSSAEAILRMENEKFSKHPLTSHYSFQTSVRGMLMSLPSPVPRNGQKMFKAESWEKGRKQRENEENIADLVADIGSCLLQPLLNLREEETDLVEDEAESVSVTLPTRAALVHDLIPFLPLLGKEVLRALPTHAASIVRELAIFPKPQATRGKLMDEDYVGEDEEGDTADTPSGLADLEEQEGKDAVVEELLYLEDDDIESCEDE